MRFSATQMMTEVEVLKEIKRKNRKKLSKDVFNCFCRLDGSCDSELIKVGYSFAPIICVWFAFIGGIGVYNFIKYDPTVVKAINLKYIVDYFRRNKKDALISLGGVVLAITDPLYWPMFVIAIMASIIASKAMIFGTFSIIQQSLALGCFPCVKIVSQKRGFYFAKWNTKKSMCFDVLQDIDTLMCAMIEQEPFEHLLVKRLKEFIGCGFLASQRVIEDGKTEEKINSGDKERVVQEVEAIEKAVRGGVVHLIGESEMVASKGAGIWKRILIDYAYNFLKKNLRQSDKVFDIPHKRMVKVGMTYEL
ncbi:Potassium transporter 19 [Glycine soja]|uniref:Potassium transporter 19 n=1 Tax=Glycine soja TaxID=3848 RepID=A0A445IGR9_GLYSO|nr:Potassium transporter 19 [Glycine soja]